MRQDRVLQQIIARRRQAARRLVPHHRVVAVIASGPSLADWQVEHVTERGAFCIATNTSFRKLLRPGLVYGCDASWWERYAAEVIAAGHEGWTQNAEAARRHGLRHIPAAKRPGLSRTPGVIHHGANSGFQAINLAYHMAPTLIVLLGLDMQHTGGRAHWHADHPDGMPNAGGIEHWQRNFIPLARDLAAEGVRVVNCSTETALTCFERANVREIL